VTKLGVKWERRGIRRKWLHPLSTFEEAKHQTNWPKWQDTIKVELASLKAIGTGTIVKHSMLSPLSVTSPPLTS
jgi:hypothetical protein